MGVALVYEDVVQHVPTVNAEHARRAAADHGIDLLVCIGGGSATGLAKAVALTSGRRPLFHRRKGRHGRAYHTSYTL